jgi:hypothetical protein
METVFDWLSIAIFAGLAVLFLQRSVGPRPENDRIPHYLPPALGCAVANYLGDHGWMVPSVALMTGTIAYIWILLKPLRRSGAV